ncbi:MAG: hypothetical protein KIS62_01390 [Ramlibacter sp.]|nr:hypothetical protein [Ramlibacter sp.]
MRPVPTARRAAVQFPHLSLPRLELMFKDGSTLWLQQVNSNPLVRQVQDAASPEGNVRIDLCTLAPDLEAAFLSAPTLDQPAVIFFTLRGHFASASAFMAAVRRVHQ